MKYILSTIMIVVFSSSLIFSQNKVQDMTIDAWIVVIDTSDNYYELKDMMFKVNRNFSMDIDAMGRGWDAEDSRIVLPDSADDPIYAGSYFPRRYPSNSLSIEYFGYYTKGNWQGKTMALVALISEKPKEAQDVLADLHKRYPSAFMIKSKIYMGCMH